MKPLQRTCLHSIYPREIFSCWLFASIEHSTSALAAFGTVLLVNIEIGQNIRVRFL